MQPAGWFVMLTSCGIVLGLVIFCYYRILTSPDTMNHMHAPLDIDTRDKDT